MFRPQCWLQVANLSVDPTRIDSFAGLALFTYLNSTQGLGGTWQFDFESHALTKARQGCTRCSCKLCPQTSIARDSPREGEEREREREIERDIDRYRERERERKREREKEKERKRI